MTSTEQTQGLVALVIDDEESIARSFVRYLQKLGVKAESVPTTKEGLEKIANARYDLVLTDLEQYPDGVQVYNAAIGRGTTAYIMSGGATPELLENARRTAGGNFLQKPFGLDVLKAIVDKLKCQMPLYVTPGTPLREDIRVSKPTEDTQQTLYPTGSPYLRKP